MSAAGAAPAVAPFFLHSRFRLLHCRTVPRHVTLVRPTQRDLDVLIALERSPLTVAQLHAVSETFSTPFTTVRRVQERLALLVSRRLIHAFPYAIPGRGTRNYYVLSREGYRVLFGQDVKLPGHRAFEPLSLSRLPHTLALAEFIVHTIVHAHRAGIGLSHFKRENTLRLELDDEYLYPDTAFRLTAPDQRTFDSFIELDNVTQALHTATGDGSFESKILFYESYKDFLKRRGLDHRFRVLFVTTGTEVRRRHLCTRAAELLHVKNRPLVYAITLAEYLACDVPLTSICLHDNRGELAALVPPLRSTSVLRHQRTDTVCDHLHLVSSAPALTAHGPGRAAAE